MKENKGEFINACEHIWGYFKKIATHDEKITLFKKLDDNDKGVIKKQEIIKYINIQTII